MKAAILGKKVGMTSVYGPEGKLHPCTVIEAGPCPVVQVKTLENDGYSAIQVGFDEKSPKNVNSPDMGRFGVFLNMRSSSKPPPLCFGNKNTCSALTLRGYPLPNIS